MKKAVSVTLDEQNLVWLRGQAAVTSRGSVSELLDRLVRDARLAGRMEPGTVRSVVGTIDLPDDDPRLEKADAYVQDLFSRSIRRPRLVRERPPHKRGRRG